MNIRHGTYFIKCNVSKGKKNCGCENKYTKLLICTHATEVKNKSFRNLYTARFFINLRSILKSLLLRKLSLLLCKLPSNEMKNENGILKWNQKKIPVFIEQIVTLGTEKLA